MEVWASKLIRYDEEKTETVKEITLLQLEYLMKKLQIRLDVKYMKLGVDSKGKEKYIEMSEMDIPLRRYFHLITTLSTEKQVKKEKDSEKLENNPDIKPDSVKIVGKLRHEIVKMNSLAEAINAQQTIDELITINELEQIKSEKKYAQLMEEHLKLREENRKLNNEMKEMAYNYAEEMRKQYESKIGTDLERIGRMLKRKDIGFRDKENFQEWLNEFIRNNENGDGNGSADGSEVERLKRKVKSLKKDKSNLLAIVKETKIKDPYKIEE